jgi:hypothetical protein
VCGELLANAINLPDHPHARRLSAAPQRSA